MTLLVSLRTGGTYEVTAEEDERLEFEVREGTLFLRRRKVNNYDDLRTFRVFAAGTWIDLEVFP